MNTILRRSSLLAPLVSAVVTAAVISGGLWLQHRRAGWPFEAPADIGAPPPATDDMAGMDMSAGAMPERVPVDVAPAMAERLNVRVETVARQLISETVRASATVVPDESTIAEVHTHVAGWVEDLPVNTTGQVVSAGQPLARIFSHELFSSQVEFLAARRNAASGITSAVVASGRTRLAVLGMAPDDIETLERTGDPVRWVTVRAPQRGVVLHRGVTVGTSVDPSSELMTIADLSRVWIVAEIPEADIPSVRLGTTARLEFPASGRAPFPARVDFVAPTLTERTRTLAVRLTVANPSGALRPGLYGTADFAAAGRQAIVVPRDAVVDTGRSQHVFVAVNGRFEPRTVTVGAALADRVEVVEGLRDGESILTSGVFLIDSESRVRATGSTGGHNHGAPAVPTPAAPPPATPAAPPAANPHAGHAGH